MHVGLVRSAVLNCCANNNIISICLSVSNVDEDDIDDDDDDDNDNDDDDDYYSIL